jgi:hypothetical protein
MGFFGELLFGSDSKKRAMSRLKQEYLTRYGDYATDIERSFQPVIDRLSSFRESNVSQYRQDFQRTMEDFRRNYESTRAEYGAGMDRALGEMRIGRESTIAMLRQTVARQEQAATARNAFSGLGSTTFGQQSVQRVGMQGALQEGAIREQYASQLSALEAQRAAGLSGMGMQYGTNMAQMGTQMAAGSGAMSQQYNFQIAQMMAQQQAAATSARGVGLAGYFGAAQARAALEGGDAARFGQMGMSIVGAGLGSWAASGFANPFAAAAPVNAGVNTAQIGVQGPYAIA